MVRRITNKRSSLLLHNMTSIVLLALLLLPTPTQAVTCLAANPAGTYGNDFFCGPQELPTNGGLDKWRFSYVDWSSWWSGPQFRSNVVSFAAACRTHDTCYDAIFDNPTQCDAQMDTCNAAFFSRLDGVCNTLPHSCQRSWCRNKVANSMQGIVELTEELYQSLAGCS